MSLLKTIQNQKFVILLVFFNKLFDMSDFCTKGLQKTSLNVETTISLIETLKKQLREFEHQRVITFGMELAAKFEITEFGVQVSSRRRNLPLALKTSHVMTTVGHNTESSVDDLVILLKRVISHISGELQVRFGHDQLGVMRVVVAFCPSSPDFMDVKLLNSVSGGYGFTIPECEIDVFKSFLKRSIPTESTLFDIFNLADGDIFPSIHQLLKILLTIPQTSVTVERLFSSVKRIKTQSRSSVST